jgi:frataxin-like iron-binding protein CyaY
MYLRYYHSDSPYSVLNHKWIYMFGDSTTRQIWASYAAPFQGNNFERNAKEWTRQYVRLESIDCSC